MTPFENFASSFKDQKVLIFGLGLQGRGIGDARVFSQIGAHVTVTDAKSAPELQPALDQLKDLNLEFHLGGTPEELITNSDVIIRNASVPWNHPLLNLARSHNIPIKMDAALFFEFARPHNAIGITGTRGKSTTTHLIHQLLKDNHLNTIMAGNAVPTASLELLKSFDPQIWYVFELSSWQLQAFHQEKISPHIAVLTNLYPDHLLDRSFEEYVYDKTAIFAYQNSKDQLIINANNPDCQKLIDQVPSQIHPFTTKDLPTDFTPELKGEHNRENLAAAYQVAQALGLDNIQALVDFKGLPFRQQKIAEIGGVSIINDTTSTTPIATIAALQTYPNSILICGGTSKQLPTVDLVSAINHDAQKIILLSGTGTDEIAPKLDPNKLAGNFSDLKSALNQAISTAKPGDTILFSPGFTSFGMFDNEFDRGRQFNNMVNNLTSARHET